MSTDDRLAGIARYAYPLGILIAISPALEILGRAWPFQWYLIPWRFQLELSALNATSAALLGALVILAAAWSEQSERALKIMSGLLAVLCVVMLPILAMLVLDGLQVRDMARSELRGTIRNNTLLNVMKGGLSALAALSLSVGAWKAAGRLSMGGDVRGRASARSPEVADNDLLIVGNVND